MKHKDKSSKLSFQIAVAFILLQKSEVLKLVRLTTWERSWDINMLLYELFNTDTKILNIN